jgi:OOP family OmpA-OmpF porin
MSASGKWWIGILVLLIIWVVANLVMTERVERDVSTRAAAAIATAAGSIDRPSVAAAGRDVTLGGAALTPQAGTDAATAAAASYGVRRVRGAIASIPSIKPYVFAARRDGSNLVLTGHVPPPSTARDQIVDAARTSLRGIAVVDRTTYALGAPDNFAAIAAYGVAQAAKLVDGTLSLSDAAYSISGATWTSANFEAAITSAHTLPAGATLVKADILPPEAKPYRLTIIRDATSLSLRGNAPSIETRDAILAHARALFGTVSHRLEIARGSPDGDFAAAAALALAAVGKLANGGATLTDKHLSITGTGQDDVTAETIAQDVAGLPPGFDLADNRVVPATAHPFAFSIKKTQQGIALAGYAPSVAERDQVLAAAKAAAGSGGVSGALKIRSGLAAGVDFGAVAALALTKVDELASGEAALTDATLTIAGEAADTKTADAVRTALAGPLPPGIALGGIDIKVTPVSPYVFNAVKRDGVVTLTGYVPDDATRKATIDDAQRRFFDTRVVDELARGNGEPGNFAAAVTAMLAQVSRLEAGAGALVDTKVSVIGDALYAKAASDIPTDLPASLPQGYEADAHVGVASPGTSVEAEACQSLFATILERSRSVFDAGTSDIDRQSYATLDRLVATAMRCPDTAVEISADTDTVGSDDTNRELSQRRAQAVLDYMVKAGIDVERLAAIGQGMTLPTTASDNEEGRAGNRRIELKVK